jgi:hypothetical protein
MGASAARLAARIAVPSRKSSSHARAGALALRVDHHGAAASHMFDFHVPSCGREGGIDRLMLEQVDGTATNGDGVESGPVSGR